MTNGARRVSTYVYLVSVQLSSECIENGTPKSATERYLQTIGFLPDTTTQLR